MLLINYSSLENIHLNRTKALFPMLHECKKWMTMKSFDLLPRLSISISSSQIRPPIDQPLCWQNPLPKREIESTYFSFFEQTKLFFFEFTRQTLDEYCLRISVWPDLAKFHHFGEYLKNFGNRFKVYLVLGKVFSSLWHNLYAIGQIFIAENGQILKTKYCHLVTLKDIHFQGSSIADTQGTRHIKSFAPWLS